MNGHMQQNGGLNGHANGGDIDVLTQSKRLSGKVAIVTGGSAGFGRAIVLHFVAAGGCVVIVDIDAVAGGKLATSLGTAAVFMRGDITLASTWQEAGALAIEKFGTLTTVINNAGMSYEPKPTHEQSIELYDKVFNLNVRPLFLSVQVLVPLLLARSAEGPSFLTISSTGYTRPRPGFSFYNASKAAVTTATKTMSLEYAPNIRFNAISPALGNTTMLQASIAHYADPQARLAELCQSIPMGRVTEPSDIAHAAVYLSSNEASFVTGTLLEVDGGRGV